MIKTGRKKLYLLCMALCLFSCIFCGCGQAKGQTGNQAGNQVQNSAGNPANPSGEITKEPDWTASFGGTSADGQQSANGGQSVQPGNTANMTPQPSKAPTPTKTLEEQIAERVAKKAAELGYPTAPPPREFVPAEGQTELVLWGGAPDEYIVAELNHILQERGYPFYLTVKEVGDDFFGKHNEVTEVWRDTFDEGKAVDLVAVGDGWKEFWKKYGKTGIERMIMEGCLLPFSEYPDTPAKERLRVAYGEKYWRLCSFGGENYGISIYMHGYALGKKYLLFNLDAAERAGIEMPETLDLLHLDELLREASAAGIPGIGTSNTMVSYYGAELLPCGLFVKCQPDGGYSFVNPFEDGEILGVCDAMNRYLENGWVEYGIGKLPLVMFTTSCGDTRYLEGDRLIWWEDGEERSAKVRVYEEGSYFRREGNLQDILGISSASRHKEEALELLCLMHTDEEIVRLLRYGVEGIHYRLGEDGWEGEIKTVKIDVSDGGGLGICTRNPPGINTIGDPRMPLELDEVAGMRHRGDAEYYGDISGVSLIPYPGDLLAGKEEQMEKIRDVVYVRENGFVNTYKLEGLWMKSKAGYQKELERMRAALAEAGYNELIAELNQRLETQK